MLAKARKAIEDVATEGNFTYIFDKSIGSILYAKDSENVLNLVKKKLGL
ncbi:MAG: OmpH family outer membrane protein [Flavobacteriales bacterium]|nr:OmpH family outer membrane protein [Flavobacteriales bacterium]